MDGLLLIDKPEGSTSFDVVRRVRKLANERKVGHTGTLDPAATGLLAVTLGACTKLAKFISLDPKVYRFDIVFGEETDTCDDEGEVVARGSTAVPDGLARVLDRFTGELQQQPPRFSAIKIDGKRAYDLARKGVEFDMPVRAVVVHRFELVAVDDGFARVEVECGGGTYMRSLARDVGLACGTRAHARHIRRTRVGPWTVAQAHTLDALSESDDVQSMALDPLEMVSARLPIVAVGPEELLLLQQGKMLPLPPSHDGEPWVGVSFEGRLAAICEPLDRGEGLRLQPRRVLIL